MQQRQYLSNFIPIHLLFIIQFFSSIGFGRLAAPESRVVISSVESTLAMDKRRSTTCVLSELLSSSRMRFGRSLTWEESIGLNLRYEFSFLDWHQKEHNEIILVPIALIERGIFSFQSSRSANNKSNKLLFSKQKEQSCTKLRLCLVRILPGVGKHLWKNIYSCKNKKIELPN